MAKEWAIAFYNSKAWKDVSKAYMTSKHYICERCGGVAEICHHKTYLTPDNITCPYVALDFDNLEALCIDCHNREHTATKDGSIASFDEAGQVKQVKESKELEEYKQQQALIDDLLISLGYKKSY